MSYRQTLLAVADHKKCSKCKTDKPLSCKAKWGRDFRKSHPEYKIKHYHHTRRWKFKTRYGITVEDYDRMMVEQQGLCSICRGVPGKRGFQVDHDHNTGKVRGLLCEPCNRGLGQFKDDPILLRVAAQYLEAHRVA